MRLHFITLLIINIFILTFSGCSTHKVEEKPPVIIPVVVESIPVVEPKVEIKPPIVENLDIIVKLPKKKPVVKKRISKQKLQDNSNDNGDDEEYDINATEIENLKKKINENKTREVREILNENPKALESIKSSKKKLLYVGPKGWRVIDIIEGLRNKKLKEKQVIAHIKAASIPYKVYTYDEIKILLEHKMPYRVITTMMNVSR